MWENERQWSFNCYCSLPKLEEWRRFIYFLSHLAWDVGSDIQNSLTKISLYFHVLDYHAIHVLFGEKDRLVLKKLINPLIIVGCSWELNCCPVTFSLTFLLGSMPELACSQSVSPHQEIKDEMGLWWRVKGFSITKTLLLSSLPKLWFPIFWRWNAFGSLIWGLLPTFIGTY